MAQVRIRQFLQPALEVDGRRVWGSQHELNRHDIVLLRLCPRPSVRVGDEGNLVKGQHLAVLNIDSEQAASEINGPAAPYHDARRAAGALIPVGQTSDPVNLPDGSASENLEKIDGDALPLSLAHLEWSNGQRSTVR
jgi:hypothetical protein